MFDKLRSKFGSVDVQRGGDCAPSGQRPSLRSVYQSRALFGVNFGSLFVLEKYIYGDLFEDDSEVELDAVKVLVRKYGVEGARSRLESHWTQYCRDSDWEWLKSKGVNSVRIPIGYWHVSPQLTRGTGFEAVREVYSNAWAIFKQKYLEKASQYGISVLVDLHALPHGANTGDHSGEKFSSAGFWDSSSGRKLAVDVCTFVARDLKAVDNVSGFQIVNEACFDDDARKQKRYYFEAINAIRQAGWTDVPVVISDGWWTEQWVEILDSASKGDIGSLGILVDSHVYRCFSDQDKAKDVERIIGDLPKSVLCGLSKPIDVIVGEYSCVLDGQTWDKSCCDRNVKVVEYGQAQSRLFDTKAMGSYFWTYKFKWGDGGEWGFVSMVNKGAIPTRSTNPNRVPDENEFKQALESAYNSHCSYWQAQSPNTPFEHWRFKEGFTTGWNDSLAFLQVDNSRIGRVVAWRSFRLKEHTHTKGASQYLWQWEHGFNEALAYFRSL